MQYSDEQIFEIGKTNYQKLALHCQTLEVSGYWDEARAVTKQSAADMLDLYVQSVLLAFAVSCEDIGQSQMDFVCTIPVTNPLGIGKGTEFDESLTSDVKRVYHMPPILLQLCSLSDVEKNGNTTEYFLDAMLNLVLCMAALNGEQKKAVNRFLTEYYNRVNYYINARSNADHANYLQKKLNSNKIDCDVEKKPPLDDKAGETEKEIKGDVTDCVSVTSVDAGKENRLQEEPEVNFSEKPLSLEESLPSEDSLPLEDSLPQKTLLSDETPVFPAETSSQNSGSAGAVLAAQEESRQNAQKERQKEEENRKALLRREWEQRKKEQEEEELSRQAKEQFMLVKKRIMDRESAQKAEQEKRVQDLMDELNALVGLQSVKKEIQSLINLIKIRGLRQQMNLPEMDMSYHMVFTGNPGTGKTTVARLVAKLYKELGVLSDGQLVETDRAGLVAGYVGQTAIKVHEIVDQAIGGILFIDEAYALNNPDVQNDFGTEAVDTLVKLMEDHRDNLVIIVAGYTDEMKNFLKSNTGLISRFNKFIDFPDYTESELVSIMDVMANKAGLRLEDQAKQKLSDILDQKDEKEWKDFGNARGIRNLFEKFVVNQANRLVEKDDPDREDLITIREEDVAV